MSLEKFEPDSKNLAYLETVLGVGYNWLCIVTLLLWSMDNSIIN